MKKLTLILLLAIGLFSCEDEKSYNVTHELAPYIETFYSEAAERGVNIPKNLNASLGVTQGVTLAGSKSGQNEFIFNKTLFNNMKSQGLESNIEGHVFYDLAGLFLHKSISTGESFMNPQLRIQGYDQSKKEALFDELFK